MRGRMTQLVLGGCCLWGLLRFGVGVGDLDHEEGVVCLCVGGLGRIWGVLIEVALAKERVACFEPGFVAFEAALRYWRITSSLRLPLPMTLSNANRACEMMVVFGSPWSSWRE